MLYYTEAGLSHREVPYETALCIYISGCRNHCINCHYPFLKQVQYGEILQQNYQTLVELYERQATCVCFLGEGANTEEEHQEFQQYIAYAHAKGLTTALYSGRDTKIEDWMKSFDYIKLGSYQETFGSLDNPHTNQRFYKKEGESYRDMTESFW